MRWSSLAVLVAVAAGCPAQVTPLNGLDSGVDAGIDAGPDSGSNDGPVDAGMDGGTDASPDSGVSDGGPGDSGVPDSGSTVDSGVDGGVDSGMISYHCADAGPSFPIGTWQLATADLNNDGIDDLVRVGNSLNLPSSGTTLLGATIVYFGQSDGGLTTGDFLYFQSANCGDLPYAVATADLDGDGWLDLMILGDYSLNLVLNQRDGTFHTTYLSIPQAYLFAYALAVGDFDSDGFPDIALCGEQGIQVLFGVDGTTFADPMSISGGSCGSIVVADFNNDGHPDIASDVDGISVFFGVGDGGFPQSPSVISNNGGRLAAADLNGDGIPDLVSSSVVVFLSKGDGAFEAGSTVGGARGTPSLADLNGDGYPDLMTVTTLDCDNPPDSGYLFVALNDGAGHFHTVTQLDAGVGYPYTAVALPASGSALPGLVVGDWCYDDLAFLPNPTQ